MDPKLSDVDVNYLSSWWLNLDFSDSCGCLHIVLKCLTLNNICWSGCLWPQYHTTYFGVVEKWAHQGHTQHTAWSTDSDWCQPRKQSDFHISWKCSLLAWTFRDVFDKVSHQFSCSHQSSLKWHFPKVCSPLRSAPLVMLLIQSGSPKPGLCLLSTSSLCILYFELLLNQLCNTVTLCTQSVFYINICLLCSGRPSGMIFNF